MFRPSDRSAPGGASSIVGCSPLPATVRPTMLTDASVPGSSSDSAPDSVQDSGPDSLQDSGPDHLEGSVRAALPSVFGYLSVPGADTEQEEMAAGRRRLAAFAAREGYRLAAVFVDVRGSTETGLHQMSEALRRGEAVAVVVPDLDHLRHVGRLLGADLATVARHLRVRLLTIAPLITRSGQPVGAVPW